MRSNLTKKQLSKIMSSWVYIAWWCPLHCWMYHWTGSINVFNKMANTLLCLSLLSSSITWSVGSGPWCFPCLASSLWDMVKHEVYTLCSFFFSCPLLREHFLLISYYPSLPKFHGHQWLCLGSSSLDNFELKIK